MATTVAPTVAPVASEPPAPAPAPPPVAVKPDVPPAPAPAPPPEPKEPPAAPPTVSAPAHPHPALSVPETSPAPVLRDADDRKPIKTEPRNGLDKIDTSQYIDPIERSLISLERSLKADVPMDVSVSVSESSLRLDEEFALPKQQMMPDAAHQNLLAQLGGLTEMTHMADQIKTEMYAPAHNGFVEKIHHEREMLRPDVNTNMPGMTSVAPVSSIFDPVPSVPHSVIAQSHHNMPNAPCLMTPAVKKEDIKPLLTPKPIEDLMGVPNMMTNNISDRAKYEMEQKKMEDTKNSNFVQAFKLKQEQNLKNASSWSSLAQAGSPQNIPAMATNNQVKQKPVMDSFQVSQYSDHIFQTSGKL